MNSNYRLLACLGLLATTWACGSESGTNSDPNPSAGADSGGQTATGGQTAGDGSGGVTVGQGGVVSAGAGGDAGAGGGPQMLTPPKNFLFLLVDDLGYSDIRAFNPDTFYDTPNVDKLAASGMRFTDGYAANPVCSPTRYSIMTGKYPTRAAATEWFGGARSGTYLPAEYNAFMAPSEVTVAEAMREAGYKTAFLGKWHLGPQEMYWPEAQGFDVNVGGYAAGHPNSYFSPYDNPKLDDGPNGEHLPDRLADETISLIDQFQNDPFFIYLAFYSVHTPLQAPDDLIQKYQQRAAGLPSTQDEPAFAPEEQVWPNAGARQVRIRQLHATYAAMVESMDASVGRILDRLEELGLDDDTAVFFMSDNGGLSTSEGSPTSNLPLRGGKGWVYEGGIREPMIIRWPGVTEGGSVSSAPVISTDFFPTILDMAGLPLRPEAHQDGMSLVPLLSGGSELDRDALFWHYPHYSNQGGFPGGAVRMGDYKLLERFEDGRVHLYDLAQDVSEQNDLAGAMPAQVNMMRQRLHDWYTDLDARFLRQKADGPVPWMP